MRSLSLLALSVVFLAACGSEQSDYEADSLSEDPIADAAPTFCDDDGELIIVEEQLGDGVEAAVENVVTINYEGRFENGEVFDSGEALSLAVNQFVPGFRDGLLGMKVGGQRELTIPGSLGYGPEGSGPIPPCATLVFDVELLSIAQ